MSTFDSAAYRATKIDAIRQLTLSMLEMQPFGFLRFKREAGCRHGRATPYRTGYAAGKAGFSVMDHPYKPGSRGESNFLAGLRDGASAHALHPR